jgi:cell division septation protein DedD
MGLEQGTQLELFELAGNSAPRPHHREALGRVLLQLRYDQLILGAMGTIIGLTVVFASGVERGKQLARSERSMLARQVPDALSEPPALPVAPEMRPAPEQLAAGAPTVVPPQPSAPVPAAKPAPKASSTESPAPAERKKEPVKAKTGKSRYAVQVVTYSRPQQAKAEMERLRATGEPAFLVIRDGGPTAVYVGPFPSKDNAMEKVGVLKSKYRDCFVKSL